MSDRDGYLKRRDQLLMQDEEIAELKAENAKLRGLMSEALSNMEYYPASLGEHGVVQDSDITAMQEALQEKGESDCRCEFQGKPVTGHFSYCPVRKDERIAELEAELEKYVLKESGWVAYDIRVQSELQSKDQELAELKKAYNEMISQSQDKILELQAELADTVTECLAAKSNEDIMRKQLAELREAAKQMIDYIEDMEIKCEWEWGSCRELNELKAANHMPDLYYQLVALQEKWG